MNSIAASMVIIPGVVALLLFLIFTYLYEQSRQTYFRAWQLGWGAYTLHYAISAWGYWGGPQSFRFLSGSLLLVVMVMCVLISTRLLRERFRLLWYDWTIASFLVALTVWNLLVHRAGGVFRLDALPHPPYRLEVGLAAVLLYASFHFYRIAYQKGS